MYVCVCVCVCELQTAISIISSEQLWLLFGARNLKLEQNKLGIEEIKLGQANLNYKFTNVLT